MPRQQNETDLEYKLRVIDVKIILKRIQDLLWWPSILYIVFAEAAECF